MGNHCTSWGVRLSRAEVIAAYPITPQTQVVEELSEICAKELLAAKFIKVESEHSAMACCIGASQAGARAFTATSSQGLALMHEMLFWAAYARLPIVLANVNRAMAPGWNIWSDQTDSLAQRDTGWIQLYCEDNQEVLDTIIMAYKLAERVNLPVMVVYEAFILSHTYEPVEIPDQADVDRFLPRTSRAFVLDTDEPRALSPLVTTENYMEFRHVMQEAHEEAKRAYADIAKDFTKRFHRHHGAVEYLGDDDADIVLVTSGSMTSTARVAADKLRERGEKVGILKMRMFRPFPVESVREIVGNVNGLHSARKLAVLDRNIGHGNGGIWTQEIRAALTGIATAPQIFSFHIGLGGRDVTPEDIMETFDITKQAKHPGAPVWIGLKK
jgi:pyruvate/2-oxoacid:ferredoxin oxidoreductase alpha subunit